MSALQGSRLGWYARRFARMSPLEMGWRARDKALQTAWSVRQVQREGVVASASAPASSRQFGATLPADIAKHVPAAAKDALLAAADGLLRGE